MSVHPRGEYRPFFEAWFDGKDYRELTPEAKLTLLTLKGTLGACGIGADPGLELSIEKRTGHQAAETKAALAELVDRLWIKRQGDVIWLVRGLEFEPHLVASNSKHRKFIARTIAALPRLAIVDEFKARYMGWFEGDAIPIRMGIGITAPAPSPAPTKSAPSNLREGEARPHSRVEKSGTAPLVAVATRNNSEVPGLPAAASQFLRVFYANGRADRFNDVAQQLKDTLAGGCRFEGGHRLKAVDEEHLAVACSHILANPPRVHDAAIRLVLLRIRDTFGETNVARQKATLTPEPPRQRSEGSGPTRLDTLLQARG